MSRMKRRKRTLSLRFWLILTVVATLIMIGVAEVALSLAMGSWQQQAEQSRLAAVRHIIGTDTAQWHDGAWQRRAGSALAAWGVEMQLSRLMAGSSSHLVYTTP